MIHATILMDFVSGLGILYRLNMNVNVKSLSCVRLLATPWTVAYQAPLSLGFSRQEYWSGLPFPSPGDLPNSGIKPESPVLQADALPSEPPGKSQGKRPWFNSWVRKIPWRRDRLPTPVFSGFPGGSDGKESSCNVVDLGWEDLLEKGKATHSSILAWRIPWIV